MRSYDIPQDVQYGDIDYMDRQLDFTINPKTYNGLPDYVRELKKDGIRYITILVSLKFSASCIKTVSCCFRPSFAINENNSTKN